MAHKGLQAAVCVFIALSGICMASTAGISQPRAGGLYIIEAVNASFASAQEVTLNEISPATAYMVGYPYRDAGVLDTAALIQDPTFSPQGVWLAGPVGTLFGTGINATAVLLLVNGAPVYDFTNATLTLNITVITDPTAAKFQDGIARQTYQNSVTPNQFARVVTIVDQVGPGGLLTDVALYLDVDQTQIVPQAVPPVASPTNIVNNNNTGGQGITNNNNNNNGGGTITNNNGVGPMQSTPTAGVTNNNGPGITNNNNNGPPTTTTAVPNSGPGITNNNNNGPPVTTTAAPNSATVTNTNNNLSSGGGAINNNKTWLCYADNGPNGTPVPSAPGQTPAPSTYNVVTTTSDCNGGSTTVYSYVPGLHGISRNNNNNCGR